MYWGLIDSISTNALVHVKGQAYLAIGKAIYATESAPDIRYAKIFLNSHFVLVISPNDGLICFGKNEGNIGEDFVNRVSFEYKGDTYTLNAKDNQRVLQVIFGDPQTVEGDVSFWDYENIKDKKKVISLGIVTENNERADIVAEILEPSDIEISKT